MTVPRLGNNSTPALGPLLVTTEAAATDEPLKRVDLRSIGTAVPRDAARVALGLRVSVPETVTAFYRAPAALVQGLPDSTATAVAELLASLGCEVEVVPADSPMPEPERLVDVAVHVRDEARFDEVAKATGVFLGCSEQDARRLLLATPPVLLGSVSSATVDALRHRLGEGVTVSTSDPDVARYDLLLGDCPAVQRSRLISDLRGRGLDPADAGPWLLRDISKQQADAVWAAHRRTPGLQIANHDFYIFEVVLDAGSPGPAAIAALTAAGIPADVVPQLFSELPIIVADELPEQEAILLIGALSEAGLEVHAELVTFLQLCVRVSGWTSAERVLAVLDAAGVPRSAQVPPFLLGPWPELTARLVRSLLMRAGASADLTEAHPSPADG